MGKKQKQEECPPGAPLWMATFGDLMSLLLTFFVLLLSFATMEESGFKAAMGSIQGALGVLSNPVNQFTVLEKNYTKAVSYHYRFMKIGTITDFKKTQDIKLAYQSETVQNSLTEVADAMTSYATANGLAEMVTVDFHDKGLKIRIPSILLFSQGTDKIKKDKNTLKLLNEIVTLLTSISYGISIEGHTDNTVISNMHFNSNWELSAARALTVLKFLLTKGISPERLKATACGEFQPFMTNTTLKGRKLNRRVEINLDVSQKY